MDNQLQKYDVRRGGVNFSKHGDITHLLNVFPEELWRIVLANVQNANEYLRLCGASPFFQERLVAHKIPLLLAAVVHILLRYGDGTNITPKCWPALVRHNSIISMSHFLTHRRVSRGWNEGINRIYHNLPYQCLFWSELHEFIQNSRGQVFRKNCETFISVSDLTAFDMHYSTSHFLNGANPFITRAIEINLPNRGPELAQFILPCLDMLRKYGSHVWHLTIHGDTSTSLWSTAKQFAIFLNDVLQQVPNLKGLQYRIRKHFSVCEPLGFQFPTLAKLEFFDQDGLPLQIVKAHLQSSKPTKVGVTLRRELSTNIKDILTSFCSTPNQISKLRIELYNNQFYWDRLFSKLETNFGEKLTHLNISLPRKGLRLKGRTLQLPQLKVLHVQLEEYAPPEFLLGLKNLEKVTIETLFGTMYEEFVCIRVRQDNARYFKAGQNSQHYVSDFWERFSNLRKITICDENMDDAVSSKRKMYEAKYRFKKYLNFQ